MRRSLTNLVLFFLLMAPPPHDARGGTGVGELSLDRNAIVALMQTAMPRELTFGVPGVGEITVKVEPPRRVDFHDGGVEVRLIFSVEELQATGAVEVRYVPQVEPTQGQVSLVAETAVPDLSLPLGIDLAPLLPPVKLPRSFGWSLEDLSGKSVRLQCMVQGVVVEDERLVIQLGFLAK